MPRTLSLQWTWQGILEWEVTMKVVRVAGDTLPALVEVEPNPRGGGEKHLMPLM